MGMAASQARLLTLTSRLHDIELKAQNIEGQKIALATQKDDLYQDYCEALDAKKIQVAYLNSDGSKTFVDATYATVCGYQPDRAVQFSLTDSRTGQLIVDEKTAQCYEEFDNDKYGFAWAMLDMAYLSYWGNSEDLGCNRVGYDENANLWLTEKEQMVFDKYINQNDTLKKAWDDFNEANNDSNLSFSEKREALESFRDTFYDLYANEIYKYMRLDPSLDKGNSKDTDVENEENMLQSFSATFPQAEFNYYVRLFEQIHDAGGYQVVSAEYRSGEDGKTWFNNMVNAGLVTIQELDTTDQNPEWRDTNVATSTSGNFLREVSDDTDLKKAEAEYEYELGVINRKDTKFDNELSKLETERTAITTEMDAIKKVRDDNIEKTFGIFG